MTRETPVRTGSQAAATAPRFGVQPPAPRPRGIPRRDGLTTPVLRRTKTGCVDETVSADGRYSKSCSVTITTTATGLVTGNSGAVAETFNMAPARDPTARAGHPQRLVRKPDADALRQRRHRLR